MDEITSSKVSIHEQGKLQSNLFLKLLPWKSITGRVVVDHIQENNKNDKMENWLVECTCIVVRKEMKEIETMIASLTIGR